MAAQTPNYNFDKPDVGADNNVWGGFLNGNWDSIDTLLKTLTDRVTAAEALIEKNKVAVDGLYFSASDTDPATTLGYGTWEPYAEGLVPVGVGTADGTSWTAGQTRGESDVTLTTSQMPSHAHNVNPPTTSTTSTNAHEHDLEMASGPVGSGSSSGLEIRTDCDQVLNGLYIRSVPDHSHTVNIPTFPSESAGGNAAHNNIQPSIGVYIWRRTA